MSARSYTYRDLTSLAGAYTVGQTKTSDSFQSEGSSRVRVGVVCTTATGTSTTIILQGSVDGTTWFDHTTENPVKLDLSSGESGSHLFECPSKFSRVKLTCGNAIATLGGVVAELSTVS